MKAVLGLTLSILSALAIIVFLVLFCTRPEKFEREKLTAIVDKIRPLLKVGEEKEFQFDDFDHPEWMRIESMEETDRRLRSWKGHVWAYRTDAGALQMTILTIYHWHAWSYGFAFSETPLTPITEVVHEHEVETYLKVPGYLTLAGEKIDDQWWRVSKFE